MRNNNEVPTAITTYISTIDKKSATTVFVT